MLNFMDGIGEFGGSRLGEISDGAAGATASCLPARSVRSHLGLVRFLVFASQLASFSVFEGANLPH